MKPKTTHINKPIKMGFLIFPDFPMACLTSMIEPLRAANEIHGEKAFNWSIIGEGEELVMSSAGVAFKPDITLANADDLDYIFLMSAPNSEFVDAKMSHGKLRHLAALGKKMGAISGGVFPLARAKLLDGRTCSVHWCYQAAFEAEFPNIEFIDDVVFVDNGRLTVAGAAAGFDLMLQLIGDKLGEAVLTEVACWFQHPLVRGEGVMQRVPTTTTANTSDMLPVQIKKAVELFSENFSEPLRVKDVAEIVGLSNRHFERKFQQATGHSPIYFYRLQRIKAARQLVMYSSQSIVKIAESVGYSSTSAFVRYYEDIFGISPREDRKKINMFRVDKALPLPSLL